MTQSTSKFGLSKPIILLLALVIFTGGMLRLYHPLWDLATFPHPDERSTLLFYAPTIHFPQNLADTLNPKKSPLNPFWDVTHQQRRSYTYGHFPLYLLVFISDTLHNLSPIAESLHLPTAVIDFLRAAESGRGFAVTGRVLVGLFDTLSIYLVFLITRKLYSERVGLLAAALYAFAVTPIQLAHFFAVDPVSTTFVLLTIYASILMLERRTPGTAILAGVAIGLAVSSKYSALPVAIVPAIAVYFIARDEKSGAGWLFHPLLWTAALASFVTFALTSPFVLLDFGNFYTAVVKEQGQMVSGAADFPFTRQYRNTPAYWYFLNQQLRWGMGWALGVLALVGTAWMLIRGVMGKLSRREWLLLAWFVPYFGLTGLFLAKFMRYMSPVIPLMVIFGAGLMATLAQRWKRVAITISAVILIATAFWAAMFVNGVYATEHSWVTASRWIYQNVPDGACIAVEHWEEGVPRDFAWAEPGASPGLHGYRQPQLPMYDPDTEQKFITIRDTLNNCDYLVIASNRMSRTLPKLSARYPMSTKYYQALFAGKLGYEPVATFETPPTLFGFQIDDQPADESFTVYDHPKATIFKKVRNLSDDEWWQILGNTWQGAQHGYIGKPTLLMRLRGADAPPPAATPTTDKSTALKKPLSAWQVVDDFRWNTVATENPALAIAVWWLAAQVIGLLAFPVTFALLKDLADGGWLLSKSLGLLLVSYGVWLLASFGLPANRLGVIWVMMALLAAASFAVWRRNWVAIKSAVREKQAFIAVGEGVFALVFLLFVAYRLANPDLWQPWNGGEKMLEIGFLNAIVKSATMPPYDPFFAGTAINYYYYGLFIVGILAKLTGIIPTTAFNLAVPLIAALTAVNVFALGGSLAFNLNPENRKPKLTAIGVGLLAVLIVVFFSNLDGMGQFLRNLADVSGSNFSSAIPGLETLVRGIIGFGKALGGTPIREYNYWDVSRVIPATINEFPYWSFLFADLHPHMIGIPFTVLFLAMTFGLFQNGSQPSTVGIQSQNSEVIMHHASRITLHASLFTAFVLGALAIINTWDMPTYLGLAVTAFGLGRYRAGRSLWRTAGDMAFFGAVVLAGAMILYRPFFANYRALDVGLGLVKDKIPLDQFLKLWGFFLLVIFSWLWLELRHPHTRFTPLRMVSLGLRRWNVLPHLLEVARPRISPSPVAKNILTALGVTLGAAIVLAFFRFDSIAIILPALAVSLLLLFRRETPPAQAFVELLVFTGLLLLLGVQIFFLRDFLGGGDYYRMNTYFKFFIQVWTLFGLAAAVILPVLWKRSARWQRGWRWVWQATVAVMVTSSLVFFVLGTRARLNNRFPGAQPPRNTLDGMAYMTVGQFSWENTTYDLRFDYDAIKWMQENIHGTPIIAEAKIGYYREWGMRVAAYTGLPSVLGGLHQSEQHFPQELGQRDGLVNQFWFATDPGRTLDLMDELGIEYVYFGQLERALYGEQSQARFDALVQSGEMEVAYRNERTVIYRRVNNDS